MGDLLSSPPQAPTPLTVFLPDKLSFGRWGRKREKSCSCMTGSKCLNNLIEVKFSFHKIYPFKVSDSEVVVQSELCRLHHSQEFRTLSWPLRRNCTPITITLKKFPPSSRWPPLIYFLGLWICPFWTFHSHGSIQCVVFCD